MAVTALGLLTIAGILFVSREALIQEISDAYELWSLGSKKVVLFYDVSDVTLFIAYPIAHTGVGEIDLRVDEGQSVETWKIPRRRLIEIVSEAMKPGEGNHVQQQGGMLMVKAAYADQIRVRKEIARLRADLQQAPLAIEHLKSALRSKDPETRASAALAIGLYSAKFDGALALLDEARRDPDPTVRRHAEIALGRIGAPAGNP